MVSKAREDEGWSQSRAKASVGWSEFLPRYLLVEGALAGKRVLELGTADPRALRYLNEAGAAQVVGTTAEPNQLSRLRLPRGVDLVAMDTGRADFPDASFDVVLVVDLASELAAGPRFLEEVRRILAPQGFALLAYPANGRGWTDLLDDQPAGFENRRLNEQVRATFSDARFYFQTPFAGVTIDPEGGEAQVALEPAKGPKGRPSVILALVGQAPRPSERTLIELSFGDVEALADAAQAGAAADRRRLAEALQKTRNTLAEREAQLQQIGTRLPKLKAAILSRQRSEVVAPTVLERPVAQDREVEELRRARDLLAAERERLGAELREERALREAAETKAAELAREADLLERMVRSQPPSVVVEPAEWAADLEETILPSPPDLAELARLRESLADKELQLQGLEVQLSRQRVEIAELRAPERGAELNRLKGQVEALERALDQAEAERRAWVSAQDDASETEALERRILHLERTNGALEEELQRAHQQLEDQLLVQHTLGADHRDAAKRVELAQQRMVEAQAQLEERERRNTTLSQALAASGFEVESLRGRLSELELVLAQQQASGAQAERGRETLQRELAAAEQRARLAEDAHDKLRAEVHQRTTEIEDARRHLQDTTRRADLAELELKRVDADRRALELTAGHLSREQETLKKRVQALRQERDTLAAASRLLLEERDVAASLARRTLEAETQTRQLALALEGGQAALDRLERETDEAKEREAELRQKLLEAEARAQGLQSALEAERKQRQSLEQQTSRFELGRAAWDQKAAQLQEQLAERDSALEAAQVERTALREHLVEVSVAAASGQRELWHLQEEQRAREATLTEVMGSLATLHAQRSQAEAEAVEARAAWREALGRQTLLAAELTERNVQIGRLEAAQADLVAQIDHARGELELFVAQSLSPEELAAIQAELQSALHGRQEAVRLLQETQVQLLELQQNLVREVHGRQEAEHQWRAAEVALALQGERLTQAGLALEAAQAEHHRLEQALERARQSLAEVRAERESLRNQNDELLAEWQVERAAFSSQRQAEQATWDATRAAWEAERERLDRQHGLIQRVLDDERAARVQAEEQAQQTQARIERDALRSFAHWEAQDALALAHLRIGALQDRLGQTLERDPAPQIRVERVLRLEAEPRLLVERIFVATESEADPMLLVRGELDRARLRVAVAERAEANHDLADQLRRLSAERWTLAEQAEALAAKVQVERAERERQHQDDAERYAELAALERLVSDRLVETRARLVEAEERAQEQGQRATELETLLQQRSAEVLVLRTSVADLEETLAWLRSQEIEHRGRLAVLESRLSEEETARASVEAGAETLLSALLVARHEHEATENERSRLAEALEASVAERGAVSSELATKLYTLETVAARVDALQGELEQTREQLEAVQAEREALRVQLAADAEHQGRAMDLLRSTLKSVADDRDQAALRWSAELEALRAQLTQMEAQARRASEAEVATVAALARAETELALTREARAELEQALTVRTELLSNLRDQLALAESAQIELSLALEARGQVLARLQERLAQLASENEANQDALRLAEARSRQRHATENEVLRLRDRLDENEAMAGLWRARAEDRALRVIEVADTHPALPAAREQAWEERVAALLARLAATQSEHEAALEQVQARWSEAESEARRWRGEALRLQNSLERLDAELSAARNERSGSVQRRAELMTVMAEHTETLESFLAATTIEARQAELRAGQESSKAAEALRRAELAEARAAALDAELSNVTHNASQTDSLRKEYQVQLERSRLETEALQVELATHKQRLSELQIELADYSFRAASAEAAAEGMDSLVGEQRLQAQADAAALDAALAERAALEARLLAMEARLAEADQLLAQAGVSVTTLEQRLHEAEARDAERALEIEALRNTNSGNEDLRRSLERAGEAENRAVKAEAQASRLDGKVAELELSLAQLDQRAKKAEERADRAEQSAKREQNHAEQAEERARVLEIQAREADARARDQETKRRQGEGRIGQLEARAEFAERRVQALESEHKQLEARLRTAGLSEPAKSLELQPSEREELKRLTLAVERSARELDEARAEVGRKLAEIRQHREGLDLARRHLSQASAEVQTLREKLARQGDADLLKDELGAREQELARLTAELTTLEAERQSLRQAVQQTERREVQSERRIAELEASVADRDRRLEMARQELQEKAEKLRRLSGLTEV